MTPFFNPGPNPHGGAKVFLAGVGELMTEVAGEVCDGFLCHGFTTERYLREVTLPALERGAAKVGRTLERFEISGPASSSPAATRRRWTQAAAGTRQQIAFYGSTPAYSGVLELHGWGELQDELNGCRSRASGWRWASSSTTRSSTRSPSSASPRRSRPNCIERYGDVIDRISFYAPYKTDPDRWLAVMEQLKAI